MLVRGQKSFKRILMFDFHLKAYYVCISSYTKIIHLKCAWYLENLKLKHDHNFCVRHSAEIADLILSHICLSVSVL